MAFQAYLKSIPTKYTMIAITAAVKTAFPGTHNLFAARKAVNAAKKNDMQHEKIMVKLDGEELDIYVAASTLSNGEVCYALGKKAVAEFKDDLKRERAAAKEERAKLKAAQEELKAPRGAGAARSPLAVKKPKHMKYKCLSSAEAPLKLIFKKL